MKEAHAGGVLRPAGIPDENVKNEIRKSDRKSEKEIYNAEDTASDGTGLRKKNRRKKLRNGNRLLLLALPFLILIFAFSYVPLFGWIYAFYKYKPGFSLWQCEFVGFDNFITLFTRRKEVLRVLRNTLVMSGLGLATSWVPMAFAVFLNEIKNTGLKKVVQTMTTLPHFVSWIIVYSLAFAIFSTDGMISNLHKMLGLNTEVNNPLGDGDIVWIFQLFLSIWKTTGWNAIIYIAAISGIDQDLYDAASVDGAGRFQKMRYVTLPGLMSTFFVLLLLAISNILSNGFDQYFAFYNPMVADKIEVLDYYVYKVGIILNDYSTSTAIGIMKTFISMALLFTANFFSKKIRGEGIV